MVSLSAEYRDCCEDIDKLVDLEANIGLLQPKYSKAVAELLMIRLFDVLTEGITSTAVKIVCGAACVDGSAPLVLLRARSRASALYMMSNAGRPTPRGLRWTGVDDIKRNLRFVLSPTDDFIRTLDGHSLFMNELRYVRNRIAHKNGRTWAKYKDVVVRHYGAELRFVTPGSLLLSKNPHILETYLRRSRALLKALVKA